MCIEKTILVLLPMGGGGIHWSRTLIGVLGRRSSRWCTTSLSVLLSLMRALVSLVFSETPTNGVSSLAGTASI
jgi:hypothetical protein